MILIASAVVVLLVLLNGVFAMSELAVVSSRRARLQPKADKGDKGAAAALRLSEDPTRFLSAVQVGITLIGILAGAYGQATIAAELDVLIETHIAVIAPWSEQIATAVVVILITYLSLIAGELVPKRLALLHPEAIAARVAGPLSLLAKLMGPFVTLLTASTAGVLRLMGVRDSDGSTVTQEEVEAVLAEGAGAGVIEPEEQAMIHEVMRLGDRPVRVAMTPRPDVYWVSADDPDAVVRDEVRACPYSRFVVSHDASFDRLAGVVHKSDVANALIGGEALDLRALAKEPLVLPENTSLLRAMTQLRAHPIHMAFVVDEFGSLQGVVTPTDLLEMIAGDFDEAHDAPNTPVLEREDGSFLVDGRVDLIDLGQKLGVRFEPTADFHTAAGLMLHHLGRLPREGEKIVADGFEVEVIDMDARRIDKLLFRRLEADPS